MALVMLGMLFLIKQKIAGRGANSGRCCRSTALVTALPYQFTTEGLADYQQAPPLTAAA